MNNIFSIIWICWIQGNHDWTNSAVENGPVTPQKLAEGFEKHGRRFLDMQTRMYCKRCGKTHRPYPA